MKQPGRGYCFINSAARSGPDCRWRRRPSRRLTPSSGRWARSRGGTARNRTSSSFHAAFGGAVDPGLISVEIEAMSPTPSAICRNVSR